MSDKNNNICGPKCRFKLLYEGASASLADMASASATQSRRVTHLRTGMMGILRAAAPRRFNELEKHLGCRVTEVDDDTFLSCVQWLLESNRDEMSLSMLRAELSGAGFAWALEATPAALLGVVQQGPVAPSPAPAPQPREEQPSHSAEESPSLDDLFVADHSECPADDKEEKPEPPKKRTPPNRNMKKKSGKSAVAKPEQEKLDVDAVDMLSQVFAEATSTSDKEEKVAEEPQVDDMAVDEPTPAEEAESTPETDLGDLFAEEPAFAGEDMFADGPEEPVDFSGSDFLDGPDASEDIDDSFGDLDGDFLSQSPEPTPPTEKVEETSTAAVEEAETDSAEAAEEPAVEQAPAEEKPAETPEEPAVEAKPARQVVRSSADVFSPFQGIPSAGKAKSKTTPVRPKRKPSVSATAPGEPAPEVDANDALRLPSLALLPRPTFISDLIALTNDAERVDAWVESERAKEAEGNHEFKFINVKKRYSDRGSLVIPEPNSRHLMDSEGDSWWLTCLNSFAGATLVEIAALTHSLGDRISEVKVSDDREAITILTRGSGGTTAVVVSTRIDGTLSDTVTDAVAELSAGMYEMVMVLHTNDDHFEEFVPALTASVASRNLQPAMPVAVTLNRQYLAQDFSSVRSLI